MCKLSLPTRMLCARGTVTELRTRCSRECSLRWWCLRRDLKEEEPVMSGGVLGYQVKETACVNALSLERSHGTPGTKERSGRPEPGDQTGMGCGWRWAGAGKGHLDVGGLRGADDGEHRKVLEPGCERIADVGREAHSRHFMRPKWQRRPGRKSGGSTGWSLPSMARGPWEATEEAFWGGITQCGHQRLGVAREWVELESSPGSQPGGIVSQWITTGNSKMRLFGEKDEKP